MKSIWKWCIGHPTQATAIAVIVLGWFSFILPPAIIGGLGSIIGILLGVGVHSIVTPVADATAKTVEAATQAATEVAKQLTDTTVGSTGYITKAATEIVNNVVDKTVGNILGGKE